MNLSDLARNSYIPQSSSTKKGYTRWWHSFSGVNAQTGNVRTFFVEFFLINPGLGSEHPILGQLPYHKKHGIKPSYLLVKAGVFPDPKGEGGKQLHAFYPISSLQITNSPLVIQTAASGWESDQDTRTHTCFYSEDRITGFINVTSREARHRSLMSDSGYMEWDLEIGKTVSCHTGIWGGPLFQALRLLDSYWHGEGIRSFFRGNVVLDGESYEVSPDLNYGYADKHWGRAFQNPWFQFACGKLTSQMTQKELRHSVLAVNEFRPRLFCIPLRPRFMIQLTYMGEDFEFTRCKWSVKETGTRFVWHISARNKNASLRLSGSCKKSDMLHLRYETPDGRLPRLPLWAGAAGIGTVRLYRHTQSGRELLDTLYMENALCIYQNESPKK